MAKIPVALYIPNVMCYIRILTAFYGLYVSSQFPVMALWTWIFSASLDLFDGMVAREFNQCSRLGVLLDICADNILRTCVWIAAIRNGSDAVAVIGCWFISLEWFTMLCTQLHAVQNDQHWKLARENDPWFVREVFRNGFKSPLGIFTIYGLFFAQMWFWASAHTEFTESIPLFNIWSYAAYLARGQGMMLELYLCQSYVRLVIKEDTQNDTVVSKKD